MLRRIAIAGMVLFALLGTPRVSHAGLLEFIWELSGPRLIGSGAGCLSTPSKWRSRNAGLAASFSCLRTGGRPIRMARLSCLVARRCSQSLTTRTRISTTAGSTRTWWPPSRGYWASARSGRRQAGDWATERACPTTVSLATISSPSTSSRSQYIPIEATRGRWILGLKFRIYPNGFTDDEFGFGPRAKLQQAGRVHLGRNHQLPLLADRRRRASRAALERHEQSCEALTVDFDAATLPDANAFGSNHSSRVRQELTGMLYTRRELAALALTAFPGRSPAPQPRRSRPFRPSRTRGSGA